MNHHHKNNKTMKSEIQINNTAEECHIDIEGTIGVAEEWQFDEPEERVATYERFREAVRRIGAVEAQRIVVNIRSTGGDVNDALLIHDALKQTGAHVTTRCYGYVASAATIIAQAASEGCREISANALYLIHTSVCATEGNAAELAGKTELLRQTDARIATIYAARSGRPAEEFEALMNENNGNGRWLSPEETVAAGLADRVIDTAERPAASLTKQITRGWRRLLAGIVPDHAKCFRHRRSPRFDLRHTMPGRVYLCLLPSPSGKGGPQGRMRAECALLPIHGQLRQARPAALPSSVAFSDSFPRGGSHGTQKKAPTFS